MLMVLHPEAHRTSFAFEAILRCLQQYHLRYTLHPQTTHLELVLQGDFPPIETLATLPGVIRITPIPSPYRLLATTNSSSGFTYQGVSFSQHDFHCMIGLCAVDTPVHVEAVMQRLQQLGQTCTRMGAYKPRTSPYTFQGHGRSCLPYIFELAGKYGIRVIAMEVMDASHIDEINEALAITGSSTGVMLQIGTRNCQNYSLLQAVGSQTKFPVLLKRGFGISLHESLMAAEYIAHAGNPNIVFCLRGIKSLAAAPHRNLADFAQVPLVKRLTRMPVCVDPSHAIGVGDVGIEGISDIHHAAAQGVIAGANLLLVDCHPHPAHAWVDGHQALTLEGLVPFLEDMALVRTTYLKRCTLLGQGA